MKKLILVANDSPDTGKSLISALLSFYLQRKGIPHLQMQSEEDTGNTDDRVFFDLLYEPTAKEFLAKIEESPATIFDISTGQTDEFLTFYQENDLSTFLQELEVELTLVSTVDGSESSLESLIDLANALGNAADFVVAHNSALSELHMKDYWPGSSEEEALENLELTHLELPDLFDEESGTLSELASDLAAGISLTADEEETDEELVDALERNVKLCFTPIDELLIGSSEGSSYDWGSTTPNKQG